jgi:hypothetical protein
MATEETKKVDQEPTAEATATATAGTEPKADPMALSIGDLKNLTLILDTASTRGAFKAGEMAGVGFIYNKLTAFLQKVEAQQPQAAAPTTAPTESK